MVLQSMLQLMRQQNKKLSDKAKMNKYSVFGGNLWQKNSLKVYLQTI